MKRFYSTIIFLLLLLFFCCTTPSEKIVDLRKNANFENIKIPESYLWVLDSSNQLNYTRSLLCAYKLMDYNPYLEKGPNCITCNSIDWLGLSAFHQCMAFLGDHKNVLQYANSIRQVSTIELLKRETIVLQEARATILEKVKQNDIVIFNEAHNRVQTRAYFLSMLTDLRKVGFTHLALEMLNRDCDLNSLNSGSGYYCCETIGGQLVREAIRLGFVLVAYEDEEPYRDYKQAKNLLKAIATKTGIQKTIVLAGYGHASETVLDTFHKPMACYFKEFSKIDPYTINLIDFIEYSENSILKIGLDSLVKTNIERPMVLEGKEVSKIEKCIFENDLNYYHGYDLFVYHPNTVYQHGRPTWLLTSADKEFVSLPLPLDIKPVLVQAYLKAEITTIKDFASKVPFDLTFMSEEQKLWLVLAKNKEYIVVFRDENNLILRQQILKT